MTAYKKKGFLEKSLNRKVGGYKRSLKHQAKKNLSKAAEKSGCATFLGYLFMIIGGAFIALIIYVLLTS